MRTTHRAANKTKCANSPPKNRCFLVRAPLTPAAAVAAATLYPEWRPMGVWERGKPYLGYCVHQPNQSMLWCVHLSRFSCRWVTILEQIRATIEWGMYTNLCIFWLTFFDDDGPNEVVRWRSACNFFFSEVTEHDEMMKSSFKCLKPPK